MNTIYKYPMPEEDEGIMMPEGAKILCLQMQAGYPHIWAIVDDEAPKIRRQFLTIGTGWDLSIDNGYPDIFTLPYIGTWQSNGLVWHVFEVKS